jgi:hypothetical protein
VTAERPKVQPASLRPTESRERSSLNIEHEQRKQKKTGWKRDEFITTTTPIKKRSKEEASSSRQVRVSRGETTTDCHDELGTKANGQDICTNAKITRNKKIEPIEQKVVMMNFRLR